MIIRNKDDTDILLLVAVNGRRCAFIVCNPLSQLPLVQGLLLEGACYTAPCSSYLTGSGNDDEHSIVSGVTTPPPPFGPFSSWMISQGVQLDEVVALLCIV